MLTQCPNCQTTFRITSEILRVAHGQVRCGRCHTQFDALERLIEEDAASDVQSGRYLQPPQPQIEVEEPQEQEDITLEGRRIEITGTYRALDDPDQPVRQEVVEEWVEIEDLDAAEPLASDGIEVVEEPADEEHAQTPADDFVPAATESEQERFARRLAENRRPAPAASEPDDDLDMLAPRRARRTALVWKILALPLVLLLIAQIVHHYRSELARHPQLGTPVTQLYSALGLPLIPDWQLHAYEIKQWGVLSDPAQPGTLKVRASVTNRASHPQPYPLLKLVLEDRWGDQVRAREFEPTEYLDPGIAADRLLTPGQPTNATIAIVDPGPDAEGFRFDVCLRGHTNTPVCAADVPQ